MSPDALPAILHAQDMMRIFGISQSHFYRLQADGRFDRFRLKPTIGRVAYSGRLVQQYLDGELPAFSVVQRRTGTR